MWICKARGTKCNLEWSRDWSTCFQGWQSDLAVLQIVLKQLISILQIKEASHTTPRRDPRNLPPGQYDLPWIGIHVVHEMICTYILNFLHAGQELQEAENDASESGSETSASDSSSDEVTSSTMHAVYCLNAFLPFLGHKGRARRGSCGRASRDTCGRATCACHCSTWGLVIKLRVCMYHHKQICVFAGPCHWWDLSDQSCKLRPVQFTYCTIVPCSQMAGAYHTPPPRIPGRCHVCAMMLFSLPCTWTPIMHRAISSS